MSDFLPAVISHHDHGESLSECWAHNLSIKKQNSDLDYILDTKSRSKWNSVHSISSKIWKSHWILWAPITYSDNSLCARNANLKIYGWRVLGPSVDRYMGRERSKKRYMNCIKYDMSKKEVNAEMSTDRREWKEKHSVLADKGRKMMISCNDRL